MAVSGRDGARGEKVDGLGTETLILPRPGRNPVVCWVFLRGGGEGERRNVWACAHRGHFRCRGKSPGGPVSEKGALGGFGEAGLIAEQHSPSALRKHRAPLSWWWGGGSPAHPLSPPCRTPPSRRRRSPAPCAAPAAVMPSHPAPAGTCPPSRMSPKGSWAPGGSPKMRKKEKSSSERGWRGKEAAESQHLESCVCGWGFVIGILIALHCLVTSSGCW